MQFKLNQFRLVLTRLGSQLNLILQNPERDCSCCIKVIERVLRKILTGEKRFGFSRNELQTAHNQQSQSRTDYSPPKQKHKQNDLHEQFHRVPWLLWRARFEDRETQVVYGNVDPLLQRISLTSCLGKQESYTQLDKWKIEFHGVLENVLNSWSYFAMEKEKRLTILNNTRLSEVVFSSELMLSWLQLAKPPILISICLPRQSSKKILSFFGLHGTAEKAKYKSVYLPTKAALL